MLHSCGMVKEKKWVYAPDFSGKKLNKFGLMGIKTF